MSGQLTFGDKIDILFEMMPRPNGKPYTNKEVCRSTGLNEGTLSAVRLKKSNNPTFSTLQELCQFFGMPLSYFECTTEAECRTFVINYRATAEEQFSHEYVNPTVRQITLKAMNMSERGQREALRLLEWMEAADQVFQERQHSAASS